MWVWIPTVPGMVINGGQGTDGRELWREKRLELSTRSPASCSPPLSVFYYLYCWLVCGADSCGFPEWLTLRIKQIRANRERETLLAKHERAELARKRRADGAHEGQQSGPVDLSKQPTVAFGEAVRGLSFNTICNVRSITPGLMAESRFLVLHLSSSSCMSPPVLVLYSGHEPSISFSCVVLRDR